MINQKKNYSRLGEKGKGWITSLFKVNDLNRIELDGGERFL